MTMKQYCDDSLSFLYVEADVESRWVASVANGVGDAHRLKISVTMQMASPEYDQKLSYSYTEPICSALPISHQLCYQICIAIEMIPRLFNRIITKLSLPSCSSLHISAEA